MKKTNHSLELKTIDVEKYEVVSNTLDFRKDIHLYVDYISNRKVKRSVRENNIPKADTKRLVKLLSDPKGLDELEDTGRSNLLNLIDGLSLDLGFVNYDTEGNYLGYTSVEPSYHDNYINLNENKYRKFITKPLQKQEQFIFNELVNDYSDSGNEFYTSAWFGRLDKFSSNGCGRQGQRN